LKQHKPWFDKEWVGFLDQRKKAKMQWIQDPSQSNVDNLNNVRRDASRHFRNKKKAYLKAEIEELETNSKINNVRDLCRGIIDFKKGYQPRTIIVKDEKEDLVADSHSIMARWRNYLSQLLNIHGFNEVRQAEIHTAEPQVPEPSAFEVELAIEKLKRHKSPGIDQILAIKGGVEQFTLTSINLLILIGISRNCLGSGRSQTMCLSIRRAIKQNVVIIEANRFCQPRTRFYATFFETNFPMNTFSWYYIRNN
jgi:hypothetical protein